MRRGRYSVIRYDGRTKREYLYRCLRAQDTLTPADATPPRREGGEPIASSLWRYTRNAIIEVAQCALENMNQLPALRRDGIAPSKPGRQMHIESGIQARNSQHVVGTPHHVGAQSLTVRQPTGTCIECIAEEKNYCATRTTNRVDGDWGYDCLVCMNGGSPSDACTCSRHLIAGKGDSDAIVALAGYLDRWFPDTSSAGEHKAAMLENILCKIEGC